MIVSSADGAARAPRASLTAPSDKGFRAVRSADWCFHQGETEDVKGVRAHKVGAAFDVVCAWRARLCRQDRKVEARFDAARLNTRGDLPAITAPAKRVSHAAQLRKMH